MGTEKHLRKVEHLFEKSAVVNFDSIKKIVGKENYAKQLVRGLVIKGKVARIGKGLYTNRNEVSLAVYGLMPAYLGLQDALSFHDLWEQETVPVIITALKARVGIRKVMGMNVLVKRIESKYMFGYEYYDEGVILPYSDTEKTFIDLVYFKVDFKPFPVDVKKLNKYLKSYPKEFREKVLGKVGKN